MTYRELNLLEPGDWVICKNGTILKFNKVVSYRRNKPDRLEFYWPINKHNVVLNRYDVPDLQLVKSTDNRIVSLEVLYGPF